MFKKIRTIFALPALVNTLADTVNANMTISQTEFEKQAARCVQLEAELEAAKAANLDLEMRLVDSLVALKQRVTLHEKNAQSAAQSQYDYNQRNYADAMLRNDALNRALDRISAVEAAAADVQRGKKTVNEARETLAIPPIEAEAGNIIVKAEKKPADGKQARKATAKSKPATKASVTDSKGNDAIVEKVKD